MKTDDLVAALAAEGAAVDAAAAARRFSARMALAPVLVVVLVLLSIGPRPDWTSAAALPMFWLKFAVPAAVLAAAWLLVRRLGHPGMQVGRSAAAAVAPLVALSALGLLVLWQAASGERLRLLLGQTWSECPWAIALFAVPAFVLAIRALRGLAPTRLRLAGAAAGLFAGAAGAFGYAFHCPELAAPFLGAWYVAGMLLPAAAGALLGPRLLRW